MENMKEQVGKILVEVKKSVESHLSDDGLVSGGVLDSLDIMNLIMKLEEGFDIEIDPEDVLSENFDSVDAIVALVNKCKS